VEGGEGVEAKASNGAFRPENDVIKNDDNNARRVF
jgi:hypothetical protein